MGLISEAIAEADSPPGPQDQERRHATTDTSDPFSMDYQIDQFEVDGEAVERLLSLAVLAGKLI